MIAVFCPSDFPCRNLYCNLCCSTLVDFFWAHCDTKFSVGRVCLCNRNMFGDAVDTAVAPSSMAREEGMIFSSRPQLIYLYVLLCQIQLDLVQPFD